MSISKQGQNMLCIFVHCQSRGPLDRVFAITQRWQMQTSPLRDNTFNSNNNNNNNILMLDHKQKQQSKSWAESWSQSQSHHNMMLYCLSFIVLTVFVVVDVYRIVTARHERDIPQSRLMMPLCDIENPVVQDSYWFRDSWW